MLPVSRVIGHKEWAPGRKSDPTYDMNWRRGRVAAFTTPTPNPPQEEDDMFSDEDRALLRQLAERQVGYGTRIERIDEGSGGGWGYGRRIEDIHERQVPGLIGQIQALSEALVQASSGGSVDLAAVQEAARRGTAEAIQAIDVTIKTQPSEQA